MKTPPESLAQRLVQVHVVEDHFEAEILLGALQLEGIECICRSYEETAYNGLFVLQKGWGAILVSEDQVERAKEIIEEALRVYGKRSDSGKMDTPGNPTERGTKTGGEP